MGVFGAGWTWLVLDGDRLAIEPTVNAEIGRDGKGSLCELLYLEDDVAIQRSFDLRRVQWRKVKR